MSVSYVIQTDKAIIRGLIIHPEDTNLFSYESDKSPARPSVTASQSSGARPTIFDGPKS